MRKGVWIAVLAALLAVALIVIGGEAILRWRDNRSPTPPPDTQSSAATTPASSAATAPSEADELAAARDAVYSQAQKRIEAGDYAGALTVIDGMPDERADERIRTLRTEVLRSYHQSLLQEAKSLVRTYNYAGALAVLQKSPSPDSDPSISAYLKMCREYAVTEEFTGTVEHIFFHPLLAYPELAFDGDSQSKGFDNYFVTVAEYNETMRQLHERGYILIDPHLLYDTAENGSVIKKTLMLPAGKKPVILSVDDYNFLKYMRANGCVSGLTLDDNGRVITFTNAKDGSKTYADDNEVVPLLDTYIEEHPDFAYGGFKGVIALTGYEGALGYPTDEMDATDYQQTLTAAKAVADRMKETGWAFASHSYGHNHFEKRSLEQMKRDTDKWRTEVGAVVGDTDLYIYPFGEIIPQNDAKFRYLVDRGFTFFFGVSQIPYLKYNNDNLLQQRRNIDGIALRGKYLPKILDVAKILDPVRPAS